MSRRHQDRQQDEAEQDERNVSDERDERDTPDYDADFAEEHGSSTFADDMPGGPEGVREPESPTGQGGDGGMDVGTEPGDEYHKPD